MTYGIVLTSRVCRYSEILDYHNVDTATAEPAAENGASIP